MPHHHTNECTHTGLDIFAIPPLQTSVEHGCWVQYQPLATITDSGPIEFIVKGDSENYLDLTNSYIHAQVKVVKPNDTTLTEDDDNLVAPLNLFLHTLFTEVDVTLNGTLVSSSTNTYPYRAYMETLLNYGKDAKESQLNTSGYYKEGDPNFHFSAANANEGLRKRRHLINRSKTVDLIGRIHSDIFTQNRYMLNGVDLRLRFVRSKNSFALLAVPAKEGDPTIQYKIKVEHMSLFVRKAKLNPTIVLAHAKALQTATSKYPVKRVVTKIFSVPQGVMNFVKDNLYLTQKPQRLVLGFVLSKAFNGDYSKDPFEFRHFHINSLALFSDGQQIPNKPLKPDFENNTYARSYMTLFTGTGAGWKDAGLDITYNEYGQGYTFFCFDLTPSLLDGNITEPSRSGCLRLEVGFAKPLEEPIHVIAYGELDGMIEIDRARQVITDFV